MKNQLLLVWALEMIAMFFCMAAVVYFFIVMTDAHVSVLNDSATIFKAHRPAK